MIRALIFTLFLLAATVAAQYRFDNWTADDGLPQNSIYDIKQTPDGYLWMATVDGLVRFDGMRFTVFNKSNTPEIVNNRFINLFVDSSGDLWAATEESGVVRLHNGRFSSFGAAEGVTRENSFLYGDSDGNALLFGDDDRTIHFSDGQFSSFDWAATYPQTANIVHSKNTIIACKPIAEFMECRVDGRQLRFSIADNLNDNRLLAAAQDTKGIIWLVTFKGKLIRVENGKIVRSYDAADGLPKYPTQFLLGAKLRLISRDEQGSLWLTDLETIRNELIFRKSADSSPKTGGIITSNQDGAENLFTAYQDGEDNFWFGTLRNGLFRARKKVVTTISTAEGLTDNNVYPVYEDGDGTVWVGTTKGLFTLTNGRFALIESTENFYVNAIGKTPDGRILVSDHGVVYVREANRFVRFMPGQLPTQTEIYLIYSDRENALWIGGNFGLTRLKDGVMTTFTTANGLAGDDTKVIIEANGGGLWIGTYGGLSRYRNGQMTSWTESDGLPGRTIRALYEDADGTLWIGTYDGGLARFKDGKFTHYDSSIGLYNDGAFQILEDDKRNFWISSNRGIYRVNKDELNEYADGTRKTITSVAYGKSDGMLNIECNGGRFPGGVKTRDGRLLFPTQDGIAMIDPKEIKINKQPPPVVIESVKVDNKLLADLDFGNAAEPVNGNEKSKIQIEPSQQNFEIQYTALSFINSENVRFKYRLEGLDEDWVDAGNRRTAYYSHAAPGTYRFQVIAANSDGVWNMEGKRLQIMVLPPFYRTWWFAVLAAAAVAVFLFLIYRRRINQLERGKRAQEELSRRLIESQENERKRIAGELHDGLSQNLVIIKNRALISLSERENVEHAFDQMEEIAEAAGESLAEVREIAGNLRPFQIDRLGLTKAIEALVRKANSSNLKVVTKPDNIDKILPPEMEINLYRILQESLNNIIKHSGASDAAIEIKKSEKIINVEIRDNGTGFNQYAVDERKSGGFGLTGMNERARILGSILEIISTKENGTIIRLKINCKV